MAKVVLVYLLIDSVYEVWTVQSNFTLHASAKYLIVEDQQGGLRCKAQEVKIGR